MEIVDGALQGWTEAGRLLPVCRGPVGGNRGDMRIGVTCYPTVGGSGVVATELGLEMARRGHEVHFICYALPYRLGRVPPGVTFHEVTVPAYPLFQYPPYSLALASQMADAVRNHSIELLHVHYAIPHAISAYLAREILGGRPKLVVTLHGTDITVVGADPSFLPIVRLGIERADAVTAVSALARRRRPTSARRHPGDRRHPQLRRHRPLRRGLRCRAPPPPLARRRPAPRARVELPAGQADHRRARDLPSGARARSRRTSRLIGDGPERPGAEKIGRDAGIAHRVEFLGNVTPVEGALGAGGPLPPAVQRRSRSALRPSRPWRAACR